MTIDNIMIAPVVVTQVNKSIAHAKGLIEKKNISALPLLKQDGTIEGIVTSTDIATSTNDEASLETIMSDRVIVLPKKSGIKEAARKMASKKIHHIIVMDDGQVVGMVSSLDIVKFFAEN